MRLIYYPNNGLALQRKENIYKEMELLCKKEKQFHLGDGWPSDDDLISLLKENYYSIIAKQLGVTTRAIINRLERKGLFKSNRNYK